MAERPGAKVLTRDRLWTIESTVTLMLGSMITKRLIRALYAAIRKQEPKSVFDADSDQFSWSDFLVWALAGGIGLGIAKLVSRRVAGVAWKVATGSAPPTVSDERLAS